MSYKLTLFEQHGNENKFLTKFLFSRNYYRLVLNYGLCSLHKKNVLAAF